MENENIENANSPNSENNTTEVDVAALQEKLTKTEESNKQLFERAKKSEGFVKENGDWVKKEAQPQTETKKPEAQVEKQSKELDYGQKAFLIANEIKGKEEHDFVLEVMNDSGKSLDEVIESPYFKAGLEEKRQAKATEEAVPQGTRRASSSAKDSVDYWIAKGELPPIDQPKLRMEVVNAKHTQAKNEGEFTDVPVGNNIVIQ